MTRLTFGAGLAHSLHFTPDVLLGELEKYVLHKPSDAVCCQVSELMASPLKMVNPILFPSGTGQLG